MMISGKNKLVLKPYKEQKKIETKVNNSFLSVESKKKASFLELLVDTNFELGDNRSVLLPAGSKVYFLESTLQTQKWPRAIFKSEHFEEFVVANVSDVLYVESK